MFFLNRTFNNDFKKIFLTFLTFKNFYISNIKTPITFLVFKTIIKDTQINLGCNLDMFELQN